MEKKPVNQWAHASTRILLFNLIFFMLANQNILQNLYYALFKFYE